ALELVVGADDALRWLVAALRLAPGHAVLRADDVDLVDDPDRDRVVRALNVQLVDRLGRDLVAAALHVHFLARAFERVAAAAVHDVDGGVLGTIPGRACADDVFV